MENDTPKNGSTLNGVVRERRNVEMHFKHGIMKALGGGQQRNGRSLLIMAQ